MPEFELRSLHLHTLDSLIADLVSGRPVKTGVGERFALPASAMVGVDRVERVVAPQRRRLRAAHKRHRLDQRGAVTNLHPAHRGRSRLPYPQDRPFDPPDLASAGRPGAGPHPGLLPGLRSVEDTGAVAKPGRAGKQPTHAARRNRSRAKCRCCSSHRDHAATRTAPALRYAA